VALLLLARCGARALSASASAMPGLPLVLDLCSCGAPVVLLWCSCGARALTEIPYVPGHSSRAVTMDIHGHFLPSEGQGTPAALARSYPAPAASTARPQADGAT
jgi:hypothetical protein